jgi:hypothetical protein
VKRSRLPARTKPIARGSPNKKRAKPRRVSVLRDRGYLRFLREEGKCVACMSVARSRGGDDETARSYANLPCDPAHGPVNGMRSKGPDDGAISLCRFHHQESHKIGQHAFQHKYDFGWAKESASHYATYLILKEHNADTATIL